MIRRDACACGARYDAFRTGHTFGEVREMLRVGSDDPELWLNRSRPAVLRFWAQLKRDLWDVTHGYCAEVVRERGLDNLAIEVAPSAPIGAPHCDCDHCNPSRWLGALVESATEAA